MNRFIMILVVMLVGLLSWSCMAEDKQPQAIKLEQGIFAEETEGNLDKALSIYEEIVKEASASRPIAAEALYRLGVLCLKQSQAKQAQAKECLENLIKNYSDVGDFAEKGRKVLGVSDLQSSLGGEQKYSSEFIKETSSTYFFRKIGNPDPGYHGLSPLWALEEKGKAGTAEEKRAILEQASAIIRNMSEDFYRRWICCYVISAGGIQEGIPVLEEALRKDPNVTVRGVAACALGNFPKALSAHPLQEALEQESVEEVKEWIRKALAGQFIKPIPSDLQKEQGSSQSGTSSEIDTAKWINELLGIQNHNTMAFQVGPQLVSMDPDTGYTIAESVWSRLSKDEVKNGVLKAFEFSRHPRVLDVLHLGATDPSMEVRNYAYSYLRNYSYKDFAEDSKAYEVWHTEFTGHPVEEVLKFNSERFVGELKTLEGPQREIMARFMRELDLGGGDNKTSYPSKRHYLIDAGILTILDGWIQDPKASNDVIDGVFSAFRSLKPDESFVREKIFPLMDSDNERLKSAAMRYLGEAKAEWAVLPLIKRLGETKERGALWNIATSLGELGDPRAIPAMIAVIEADNTYDTVYGVGYFGLGKLTGVRYDPSHDGKWWHEWWSKNKDQFPEEARKAEQDPMLMPVPATANSSTTESSRTAPEPLLVPPDQWGLAGSNPSEYEKGTEENWCYLRSKNPGSQQFGTLTRSMSADPYRGKRLRLTATIKGEGLQSGSGMWLRVDDPNGKVMAFDNMNDRLLMGDVAEKTCEVVLDVPQEGASIHYGVFLAEKGCVHVRDMKLETVGTDVPVTGKQP